ncbi:MAG: hypothetical protein ABF649_17020, partial [Bacillus sp. (in: firmicutes)]
SHLPLQSSRFAPLVAVVELVKTPTLLNRLKATHFSRITLNNNIKKQRYYGLAIIPCNEIRRQELILKQVACNGGCEDSCGKCGKAKDPARQRRGGSSLAPRKAKQPAVESKPHTKKQASHFIVLKPSNIKTCKRI